MTLLSEQFLESINAMEMHRYKSDSKHELHHTDTREFLCGSCAAVINISATFPLNKVMFRQQLHGVTARKAFHMLVNEGYISLYRGVAPVFLQRAVALSIMFGTYDQYKKMMKHLLPKCPNYINWPVAAMLAGSTEALLTPFERVQVVLQDRAYHSRFSGTMHTFKELSQFGVKELFRGWTPIMMRNGPSNILFFCLRGPLKQAFPKTESVYMYYAEHFVCGALLGASISTLFYPINVVKTRMQSKIGGEYLSFSKTCAIVFNDRNRSWRLMFRGVHLNFTRSLISWGIVNCSYEALRKLFYGVPGEELTS